MKDTYGDTIRISSSECDRFVYVEIAERRGGAVLQVELEPEQARKLAKKLRRIAREVEDLP